MKAYIFGNGPSGLMAAHACEEAGFEVEIGADQTSPSHITGAQYLDRAIPNLTPDDPDTSIRFYKCGKGRNYAKKIYNSPDAPTSWDRYEERRYAAWYLRDVYSKLWERFRKNMFSVRLTPDMLNAYCETDAQLIVLAIPLPVVCYNDKHKFESQKVTIYEGVPTDMPDEYRHLMQQDNWIVYNGKKKTPWYRASSINGGKTIEVPGHFPDGFQIIKPLSNTCDCWEQPTQPKIVKAGRYGAWQKDKLVSSVWQDVADAL